MVPRGYLTSQRGRHHEVLRHWQACTCAAEPTIERATALTADLAWVWLVPASALVLALLAHRRRP